ncbi:MAG TPA: UDP-N-acetylglucosamine 1-carboxyvinyltransferase [Lachnospiraceae bacterium]|nr:UDP-N-acetylglucosamine 1-carboxyvinyltransferase [Lachnospiraceae bacterium]
MEAIYIHGGIALQGQVKIQGSKNAVLPVMAATLLTGDVCEIDNCPKLTDVYHMQKLLVSLGCLVTRDKERLKIDSAKVDILHALSGMPQDAVRGMRSSIILLGALLGRIGEVQMEYPGGCVIGSRPIDVHLAVLKEMNVVFEEKSYGLYATTTGLRGADISLRISSVGATENLVLAAVCAEGTTVIRNAAKEPEIVTLCEFLNMCGADITGEGSSVIIIKGVKELRGVKYAIPGDRIVAGTYLCACMAAGGEVLLKQAPCNQMEAVLQYAEKMGVGFQKTEEGLYVQVHDSLKAPDQLVTEPYPGFPTDMQSPFVSVLAGAEGRCLVKENIFENRFHTVPCLNDMGANIVQIDSRTILVEGVEHLHGYTVTAKELRGGAALVIAGIAAKGETVVDGCSYIERGYENICRDLRELGVRIYGV